MIRSSVDSWLLLSCLVVPVVWTLHKHTYLNDLPDLRRLHLGFHAPVQDQRRGSARRRAAGRTGGRQLPGGGPEVQGRDLPVRIAAAALGDRTALHAGSHGPGQALEVLPGGRALDQLREVLDGISQKQRRSIRRNRTSGGPRRPLSWLLRVLMMMTLHPVHRLGFLCLNRTSVRPLKDCLH